MAPDGLANQGARVRGRFTLASVGIHAGEGRAHLRQGEGVRERGVGQGGAGHQHPVGRGDHRGVRLSAVAIHPPVPLAYIVDAAAVGIGRLVGGPDDPVGDTNSVAGLSAASEYRYDKRHLVPFGEFNPPGFRWFTEMLGMPLGDFSRGVERPPSFAYGGQRLAPNICYEDLFGEDFAPSLVGPDAATLLASATTSQRGSARNAGAST